jgi:hypothetical protein
VVHVNRHPDPARANTPCHFGRIKAVPDRAITDRLGMPAVECEH